MKRNLFVGLFFGRQLCPMLAISAALALTMGCATQNTRPSTPESKVDQVERKVQPYERYIPQNQPDAPAAK